MSSGGIRRAILAAQMLALAVLTAGFVHGQTRATTIVTQPGASIWIDGIYFGKTDESGRLKIRTPQARAHTVRVRADGFRETSKPLAAGAETAITLTKTTDEAELAFQEAERMKTVDRQKAIEAYKKAAALRPGYLDAYIGLARAYSEAGDFEPAMKAIRDGRKIKPATAELSAIEGRLLKDTGDEDKAIAAFKRSIAEAKGFQPEAYTGLGLLYKDRAESAGTDSEFQEEEADFRQSVKFLSTAVKQLAGAPDGIVVYQLLGLIYEKQKKYKEAIALYEEFLRNYPDSAEASAVQSFITQIKKQMTQEP